VTATAIANVAVFDGARRRDGLTVVFDERVLAVGRAHEVPEVDPADTIDGTGCTLLPGLVDMHVHVLERDALPRYLDHGVTAIKDVGNDLETILAHRRAVREGDVDGPTILLCGSMLDGPEPMWPELSMAVGDEETAASAVDELAQAGVDGIKLYVYLAPEHMRAAIGRAHEHGLPVTAHLGETPASEAIALGLDGIEHAAQGYYGDLVAPELRLDAADRLTLGLGPFWARFLAGWSTVDPASDTVLRFAELVAGRGVFVCPTLIVLEHMLEGTDEDLGRLTAGWTPGDYDVARSAFERLLGVVGALHESGALVVAGSDVGAGDSLHRELELLVLAGLSSTDALRAATSGAARALRRSGDLGAIADGRRADLVLVGGDPCTDVSAVRDVRAVVEAGRLVRGARV
jgi:imidazolonepropionase-like amidohydrolase